MPDPSQYVVGDAPPQQSLTPTFEFKAAHPGGSGGRGGGYPRVRSWETRPETARQGKEDVYVPIHRLCAVAWLLPDGTLGDDVRLDALDGVDVHHDLGMPAANVESELLLVNHGDHSEVTQAEMRAYAADARRRVDGDGADATTGSGAGDGDVCDRCGAAATTLCESPDWTGRYCLECSKQESDGAAISVV
jgi:hypothetical protein